MPDYNQIIEQSHANVKALGEKLNELDLLNKKIEEIIRQPEVFAEKYEQITRLTELYTTTLGKSTKTYLDGNNKIFTEKIQEFSSKINELEEEITRLAKTDYKSLFEHLQKEFIQQTRQDLEVELKKIDVKSKNLQNKIDDLAIEIERLRKVDLESHYNKLQASINELNSQNQTTRILIFVGFIVITFILIYQVFYK